MGFTFEINPLSLKCRKCRVFSKGERVPGKNGPHTIVRSLDLRRALRQNTHEDGPKKCVILSFPDPLYYLPDISDISDILTRKLLIQKDPVNVGFSFFQKSYPTFPTLAAADDQIVAGFGIGETDPGRVRYISSEPKIMCRGGTSIVPCRGTNVTNTAVVAKACADVRCTVRSECDQCGRRAGVLQPLLPGMRADLLRQLRTGLQWAGPQSDTDGPLQPGGARKEGYMATCGACDRVMLAASSCVGTVAVMQGVSYLRIRYGQETVWSQDGPWSPPHRCRDCCVKIGGLHHEHCVVEQCPRCGEQRVGCDCGE